MFTPNKTTVPKNVKKYERDGISLNMNKRRPGRGITTRTQENFEAVRQALERNQERICAQTSYSSFCRIIKKDLR